jgi:hypothetical protein
MANLDTPRGLSPVKHLDGKPYNGGTWMCYFASGYAPAIYVGDPVIHAGSACTSGCCMTITIATASAGNQVLGPVVNFEPVGPDVAGWNATLDATGIDRAGSLPYKPASTARYANVCFDPDVIYSVQGDSVGALSKASISSNGDLIAGTGSAVTGKSGWELSSASVTTTLNLQLHILAAIDRPDNDVALVNADFYVLLNMSAFTGALGRATGV